MPKKIITIIGARPQIIKSSAISRTIEHQFKDELEEVLVHTGQHYDDALSLNFFVELGIKLPKYNLEVGSESHAIQTAKMLEGLDTIFTSENPDAVLVYGDTNSTLAGALVAAKRNIPIIHVEAGLRSFNKKMPEEINRITCDHMSTLLFSPTKAGIENLMKEGFSTEFQSNPSPDNPNSYHCGDIMMDNSLFFSELSSQKSTILADLELERDTFVLCTIHRDSNTDSPENLIAIIEALMEISENAGLKIVLPLHPRTKAGLKTNVAPEVYKKLKESRSILMLEPLGFLDIIALEKNARIIITDSGGLQKEAFFFQKPCVILRPQTEWVEIVENGNAVIADANKAKIIDGFNALQSKTDFTFPPFYGDGNAATFICQKIIQDIQ